jgi:hypothetical protein
MSDDIQIDYDVECGWVQSHGMAASGLPELEITGVPSFLVEAAATFLGEVCDSLLQSDRRVKAGEMMETSPGAVVVFVRSTYKPCEEWQDEDERLKIIDGVTDDDARENWFYLATEPIPFDRLRQELTAMGLRERPDEDSTDDAVRIEDDRGGLWAHRTERGYALLREPRADYLGGDAFNILATIEEHFDTQLLFSGYDEEDGIEAYDDLAQTHYAEECL